jgi:general secretion pathway protein K
MRRLKEKERGVALLMVLIMLALVGSVAADFQFNSRVDLQLALNARDELQAEYNALTALRMRAMLLKHSRQLQRAIDGLLGSLLGGAEGGMKIPVGQILEAIPIECSLLSAIAKKSGVEAIAAEGAVEGETDELFQGECTATSESEHSKISINMLSNPTNRANSQVTSLLIGLLSDKRMERHFQEDDRNGTHAENPTDLAGAISDWIDGDNDQTGSTSSDEERFYGNLKDRYRPKNAPLDSLAELQLVHGIDDELWDVLRDNVSIYSDGTMIELATASDLNILIGLFASMRPGIGMDTAQQALGLFWAKLTELKKATFGFMPLNVGMLRTLITESGLDSVVDSNRIGQVFTDKSSTTWYTINATGRLGNATRRIRAVFQADEGQFYYMRIE